MTILQSSKLWMVAASFSFGALAHAADNCSSIDLNGTFRTKLYDIDKNYMSITIKQEGCKVTVKSLCFRPHRPE